MIGEDVRKVTSHFEKLMEKRTKLPTSQDVYFVSKWHELFECYEMARIFLSKTEEDNWDYWFNKVDDEVAQKGIELTFKSQMLETALINYNILVDFSESKIRNTYNYIKHKGTPCYKEIEALRDTRFFNLIIGKESYPTDIRDVRKILSMDELIDELRKFDDEKLYPYVVGLIEKLQIAVDPSPMII